MPGLLAEGKVIWGDGGEWLLRPWVHSPGPILYLTYLHAPGPCMDGGPHDITDMPFEVSFRQGIAGAAVLHAVGPLPIEGHLFILLPQP